ncbi:MAG: cold shock domain-containing protein [Acidobacteriota bacterium]
MTNGTKLSSSSTRAGSDTLAPAEKVMTGRIMQIIRSRACGFIRATDGQHVFFHVSDLHGTTLDQLTDSLNVKFNLVADAVSGPRAVHVEIDRRTRAKAAPRRAVSATPRRPARKTS